jgi:hypothetical protein
MAKDYYKAEDISTLLASFAKLKKRFRKISETLAIHEFQTERGKEYALHGYSRRLSILWHCLQKTFELVPPDLEERPDKEAVDDVTMCLHAFYVNIFGACDNIAWFLVFENNIRKPDGTEIPDTWVGIRKQNTLVRQSLSDGLCVVLDGLEKWFKHVEEFRHSLAHRIPMYVPPYVVWSDNSDDYERLEKEAKEALKNHDFELRKSLREEQLALTSFRPWFTHSFSEHSPQMVIHPQLLADFHTLLDIGDAAILELHSHRSIAAGTQGVAMSGGSADSRLQKGET